MHQPERDRMFDPAANGDGAPRRPSRRRFLWLGAASSLVGASLAGFAGLRLVAAQRSSDRDDDDLDDDVDLDDDDLQHSRDDRDDDDRSRDDDDAGRAHGGGRDDDHDDHDDDRDDDDDWDDDDRAAARREVTIPAGSAVVEIFDDDDFTPSTITIDAGQTLTFVNFDGDDHTATGSGFDTGLIREQGGVASVTLDTPGRYPFACLIHPEMVGEVLVRDEDGNVPERALASPVADDAVPVQIVNMAFAPATARVATGQSVTWSNDDTVPHTVTADDGRFDSGILDPGDRFSWTFDAPGAIAYHCALHPGMEGDVVVSGDGPVQRTGDAPATADTATGDAAPSDAVTGNTTSPEAGRVDAAAVAIVDLAFEPPLVTVAAGTEVVWTNTGQIPHTVTGDDFDSGVLENSQEFRRVFADPGTYDYFCAIHPGMTGQVVVEPA